MRITTKEFARLASRFCSLAVEHIQLMFIPRLSSQPKAKEARPSSRMLPRQRPKQTDKTIITVQFSSGSVGLGATVGTGVAIRLGTGTEVTSGIGEDGRTPARGSVTAGGRRTSSEAPDR